MYNLFTQWITLVERLAQRLPNFTGKAGVCAAVLLGVQALENLLPGYKVEASGSLIVFLIVYSGLAILIGKLLNERYEDAN